MNKNWKRKSIGLKINKNKKSIKKSQWNVNKISIKSQEKVKKEVNKNSIKSQWKVYKKSIIKSH